MTDFASVDLADALTRLGIVFRKSGAELVARCPFHAERTPSWSIRADGGERHGLWRCKGACSPPDDRGSIVSLVARLLDLRTEEGAMDRAAARLWLFGGEDVPKSPPPSAVALDVSEEPSRGFRLPAGVVFPPIGEWSSLPLGYLDGRGVSRAQVDRWGLGYAFSGALAGRVVLPARDRTGAIRSYSARTFVGDRLKWRSAGVRDNPDAAAIFGEQHWPVDSRGSVVVVEAALDGLAAEAATDGARSIAAIHGSEPTEGHLAKLATFREVLVAADPDKAGDKIHAVIRGVLSRWTRVRRIALPDGLDCSALWRADPGLLRRILTF